MMPAREVSLQSQSERMIGGTSRLVRPPIDTDPCKGRAAGFGSYKQLNSVVAIPGNGVAMTA